MRIESSQVMMQSQSTFAYEHKSITSSQFFIEKEVNQNKIQDISINKPYECNTNTHVKAIMNEEDNLSIEDQLKKLIIEMLLERLDGNNKKIKLYPNKHTDNNTQPVQQAPNPYTKDSTPKWGFIFETTEEYHQKSTIEFQSSAKIQTSNGSYEIDLNISLTQEFHEYHSTRIAFGTANLEDPLIINFGDTPNGFDNISKLDFLFDIDNDGVQEEIPLLKQGSGFLAFDKNNNNKIDNGTELFGTQTGNGFNELSKYDQDDNNWIDENDSIFNHLRIWSKDEKGNDTLYTLGEVGVGAIYLDNIGSTFDYDKSVGDHSAQLKQTSIALMENGSARLVTGVDFVV